MFRKLQGLHFYYRGTKENECNSNIPITYENKCLYEGGHYKEEPKTCSDYKEGEGYDACNSLKASSDGKECRVIDVQCKEVDKSQKASCSDYKKGLESDYCISIPLEDENKYCGFTNNECKEYYLGYSFISDESVCNSIILQRWKMCI